MKTSMTALIIEIEAITETLQDIKNDQPTIRDYFAAKAMQGFVINPTWLEEPKKISEIAYVIADSMLIARQVEK